MHRTDDRRRDQRRACEIGVELQSRRGTITARTATVSRHGVFVVTDSAVPENELLTLLLQLPAGGPLKLMGQVSRRVGQAEAGARDIDPGIAVTLSVLTERTKERWESFVLEQPEPPARHAPASVEATARRQRTRYATCFLVRLRDRETMRQYFSRDISHSGTLLKMTPLPEELDPAVNLVLVHPETDEEFPLTGHIVRAVNGPSVADSGLAIRFDALPPRREAALLAFIETGANFLGRPQVDGNGRVALLREAVERDPDAPLAFVALGQALIEEQGPQTALASFQRALELDPACVPAHRGMIKAYHSLKAAEHARHHEEEIAAIEAAQRD